MKKILVTRLREATTYKEEEEEEEAERENMRKRRAAQGERGEVVWCVSSRCVPARDALLLLLPLLLLLLETKTRGQKRRRNKNEGNERGGLRVASLRGVFVRGGRTIYRVPGTEYRVPGTEY